MKDLVLALKAQVVATLSEALGSDRRVALLDYPNHRNVGDNAIWLGERTALAEVGAQLVYCADLRSFDLETLRHRLGQGVVLLHGGGSFGDIWPEHQVFRELMVSECPDLRIIQLPQTIHFEDPANLARSREALRGHPQLIVLVRDQRSLRVAEDQLNLAARLCPDMAFAIGPHNRSAEPRIPILWLARTDHETTSGRPPLSEADVEVVDWIGAASRSNRRVLRADKLHRRIAPDLARRTGRVVNPVRWLGPWMDQMAAHQLRRGARLLSQGQVVVTDRLHGHILCSLMDIPHVVLDTGYGKLSEFIAAHTASTPLVAQASSITEALTLARCHPLLGSPSRQAGLESEEF